MENRNIPYCACGSIKTPNNAKCRRCYKKERDKKYAHIPEAAILVQEIISTSYKAVAKKIWRY